MHLEHINGPGRNGHTETAASDARGARCPANREEIACVQHITVQMRQSTPAPAPGNWKPSRCIG